MEVIRNRLNLALSDSSYQLPAPRLFVQGPPRRIARLAGRMGRRDAVTEWPAEAKMAREKRLLEPLSPVAQKTTTTTTRTTAITIEAPGFRTMPDMSFSVDHKKSGETKINFKNVRFVPLHEVDAHKPRKIYEIIFFQILDKVVPTLRSDDEETRFAYKRKHLSETFTPPTTAYGPIVLNEVAVQTDEVGFGSSSH